MVGRAPFDNLEMLIDLELLTDAVQIKAVSSFSFKVTVEGLWHYRRVDYGEII
jgi:hypothetical protein